MGDQLGNLNEDVERCFKHPDASTCQDMLKYMTSRIFDLSIEKCLQFIKFSQAEDGSINFYHCYNQCAPPERTSKFQASLLNLQREHVDKWFDTLRSVKAAKDIVQNLPISSEPSILRSCSNSNCSFSVPWKWLV